MNTYYIRNREMVAQKNRQRYRDAHPEARTFRTKTEIDAFLDSLDDKAMDECTTVGDKLSFINEEYERQYGKALCYSTAYYYLQRYRGHRRRQ
jgi:hypothetical protein